MQDSAQIRWNHGLTPKVVASLIAWVVILTSGLAGATEPIATTKGAVSVRRSPESPSQTDDFGRIVVPVMIDGKGPFRFLVDTGADGSVISERLLHEIGLVPSLNGGERVEGITGVERLPCVWIAELRLGDIIRTHVRMPVIQGPVLAGLDGILGMAGFGNVQVVVNFRDHYVAIGRSGGDPGWRYLEIQAERTPGGLLMIPARVGGVSVEAVIDTGAEESMGNAALGAALVARATNGMAQTRVYGVTKQVPAGDVGPAPPIHVGSAEIRGLMIVYSNSPIFRTWHLESRPALIVGMNVLGAVESLIVDYRRARIYLLLREPRGPRMRETRVFVPWLGG